MMADHIVHSDGRAILLRNVNCPYCGRDFGNGVEPTKEHVIGRRFVPKGSLDKQWNLILNACKRCNNLKADLENDISAITMMSTDSISDVEVKQRLAAEVDRRAFKTLSRRTKKSVASSHETISALASGPGLTATINFHALPQIDHSRLHLLAELHFKAFLFWITYDKDSARGVVRGGYVHLGAFGRPNWGVAQARWFMREVDRWSMRVCGIAADEYFKINIQKCPTGNIWSCAVEWNQTMRALAFVGVRSEIDEFLSNMPAAKSSFATTPEGDTLRFTEEIPLAPEDDNLFFKYDLNT